MLLGYNVFRVICNFIPDALFIVVHVYLIMFYERKL